ncbi:hypothetical protein [Absidia glauca]|uniref:Uncharacterized protein n=1 Tax=Absidia glauca TaxID=4829 RepID=A0A168P336_ABSGL|nr:hypothetical protein [Absidia glauca]
MLWKDEHLVCNYRSCSSQDISSEIPTVNVEIMCLEMANECCSGSTLVTRHKSDYSCSAEIVVCILDTITGERRQRLKGHEMVVSGSDDGCVKLLDDRKWCEAQTSENKHQVTAVSYSGVGDMVQSGGTLGSCE